VERELPNRTLSAVAGAAGAVVLGALSLSLAAHPLRERQAIDAAIAVSRARQAAADQALAGREALEAGWVDETRLALQRADLLLSERNAALAEPRVRDAAEAAGLELRELRVGVRRPGQGLSTTPFTARLEGDGARLPALIAALWGDARAPRFDGLDIDLERFGEARIEAVLRFSLASPGEPAPTRPDPHADLRPPQVAARLRPDRVAPWNRAALDTLRLDAERLRARAAPLQRLAARAAAVDALRAERLAWERWQTDARADADSLARKVPALLQASERSPTGAASLRPAPGGGLAISAE
jgi:hypothetical protein